MKPSYYWCLGLFFLAAEAAYGCSCVENLTVAHHYEHSDSVLVVEITGESSRGGDEQFMYRKWPAKVHKQWRERFEGIEYIYSGTYSADCAFPFEVGQSYLVFAENVPRRWFQWRPWNRERLSTNLCSGSLPLESDNNTIKKRLTETLAWLEQNGSCRERLLVAESGSQNLIFLAFLTSAMPPEAVIEVVES